MSTNMTEPTEKLIPEAELRRLTMGSLEAQIARVTTAVQAHFEDPSVEVMATRQEEAVVVHDYMFYRVALQESDGVLTVRTAEPMDVEVYDVDNIHEFVEREVQAIAELCVRGQAAVASGRLLGLVEVAQRDPGFSRAEIDDTLAPVQTLLNNSRPWRHTYGSRREFIESFAGERARQAASSQLRPKFGKLYDGSIRESKLGGQFDKTTLALDEVLKIWGEARDEIEAAFSHAQKALRVESDKNEVLQMFEGFATDLIDDLRSVHEVASRVARGSLDARVRGRLHDLLVDGLHSRQVAGSFVAAVADRLTEDQ